MLAFIEARKQQLTTKSALVMLTALNSWRGAKLRSIIYGSLAAALSLMSAVAIASAAPSQPEGKGKTVTSEVSENFALKLFRLAAKKKR